MLEDTPLFKAMMAGAEACGMIMVPTEFEKIEVIRTPGMPTLIFMPICMSPEDQGRSLTLIILDEKRRLAA